VFAHRVDGLARVAEDASHGVLGEPYDLEVVAADAQLGSDCEVAAGVTEPDGRREVEGAAAA
jgi:hypothetical protein